MSRCSSLGSNDGTQAPRAPEARCLRQRCPAAARRARRAHEARNRNRMPDEPAAGAVLGAADDTAGADAGALDGRHRLLLDHAAGGARPRSCPDCKTTIWGYNGMTPGPTIVVPQRPQDGRPPDQHPAAGPPDVAVHGRGRRPTSTGRLTAAVRRLRQRHHERRPVQGLRVPERPGGADDLVPRPRRRHHRPERVHGARRRSTSLHDDLEQSLPLPHGRYDVPLASRTRCSRTPAS